MKSCDYCGKENVEALAFCAECGTELSLPNSPAPIPSVPGMPHILNFKTATIILVLTIAAQIAAGVLIILIAAIFEPARAIFSERVLEVQALMPALVTGTMLAGGFAMLMAVSKFKLYVKDTGPAGAAWVLGPWQTIVKGIGIGMVIYMASTILLHFFGRRPGYRELDGLSRMAITPGLPGVFYAIAAVILAPPLEEMLYRGLLFGGFYQSVGLDRAALGTTVIFVLLHAPQLAIQPLATFGLTAMALAALWMRWSNRSIGPAIGVHLGFNALGTLSVLMHR
jgi:membrane protease YdiL (CAAX protease family)